MHRLTKLFLALALVMSVGGLTAGIITFDDAVEGAVYPTANDSGVNVNFYTAANGTDCSTAGTCPGALLGAAYGATQGAPEVAFQPNDNRAGGPQSPFLSDEDGTSPPIVNAFDYFFSFDIGVPDLSLHLMDFRGDGGSAVGATATLDVFGTTDWSGAPLGSFAFVVPGGPIPDGSVESLSVFPGSTIFTARVSFSAGPTGGLDIGTGIDNLEWTTIPEPGTVVLFGSGLLALAAFARKRRART